MGQVTHTLRSPSELEVLFFQELRAPLCAFFTLRFHNLVRKCEAKLLAQRFKKEIVRYRYVLTERGLKVQVEPDIVDTRIDATHRAMLAVDKQIISRLTDKP